MTPTNTVPAPDAGLAMDTADTDAIGPDAADLDAADLDAADPGAKSPVARTPAAAPAEAYAHFARRLSLETDCADVHEAMARAGGAPLDFVLLDVRGPAAYARSHVPGAINLPHRQITAGRMAAWPEGTLFVAYCAGPHCNGADRAALRLAGLGSPVKVMLGGMTGWDDEGFAFAAA